MQKSKFVSVLASCLVGGIVGFSGIAFGEPRAGSEKSTIAGAAAAMLKDPTNAAVRAAYRKALAEQFAVQTVALNSAKSMHDMDDDFRELRDHEMAEEHEHHHKHPVSKD